MRERSYVANSFTCSVVVTETGWHLPGRYADNLPTTRAMSPLEGALTMWNLAGARMDRVTRAALVEVAGPAPQKSVTASILEVLSDIPLD